MNRKIRYSLIFIGFILFLICCPLLVMYVSGVTYNSQTNSFVYTGIIAMRADPKSASIFLNNKLSRTSEGDMKFLSPGEYDVRVEKAGYNPWSKRLLVNANQVTWANPAPNRLFLFLENTKAALLLRDVTDFSMLGSDLLVLSGNTISVTSQNDPAQSQNFPLPAPITTLLPSPRGTSALLTDTKATTPEVLLFDAKNRSLVNLSAQFTSQPLLQYSDTGDIYALDGNNLYKVTATAKTLITTNVKSFSVNSNNLYFIREKNEQRDFIVTPLSGSEQSQVLTGNIPSYTEGFIYITPQKQIALRLDDALYSVGTQLEKITDGVSESNFDPTSGQLVVVHNGELDTYEFYNRTLNFITRTSEQITQPTVRADIGYVLYIKNQNLQALELDLRDRQNRYNLYTGNQPKKFYISADASKLYILDNGSLISETIH